MARSSPSTTEAKTSAVDSSSIDDACPYERTSLPDEKAGTRHDRRDMARMGQTQEFRRNFSFIPIFGFAAVLMMTWASVLSSVSYILPNGGLPAMIWVYVVTLFGFGAAILSMAEMASMAPTSGGQYHWVSEFAPASFQKPLSYIVGWFCVLGWQAGVAGQCFAVASQIQGMIALNDGNYTGQPWHVVLLTIAVVTFAVLFNTFFARRLPLLEGLVLILLVFGFFAVLIPLWVFAPRHTSQEVWLDFTNTAEWPSMGLAFFVAFTGPIYALIGPDSSVHMSEEVKDASRTIPWAMVATLALNGVTGLVMSITFAYCIGPLDAAITPPYNFAFIGTFFTATNSHAGATIMSCIITTLTFCSAISNLAAASRQMFAFARDGGLPFARVLCHVRPGWDIPLNAVVVSWSVTALLSLINLGSMYAFNAILSLGVVALLSSYATSIACILLRRIRRQPLLPRRWSLGGPAGWACNIIGLVYVLLAYIFGFFPIVNHPNLQAVTWAPVVYVGVTVLAVTYYIFWARHRYVPPVAKTLKDMI